MFTTASQRAENTARVSAPVRLESGAEPQIILERARRTAAGLLGAGVVHEFANLLTVLDGIAQMSAHGISFGDCQRMIRPSADRSTALIDAYRYFFADRGTDVPVTFDAEMRRLESLLRVRLRGCKAQIDFSGATAPFLIAGRCAPSVRVAFLIVALAHVDQLARGGHDVGTLCCVPGGAGDSAEWVLRSEPTTASPAPTIPSRGAQELLGLAGALISQWGSSLRSRFTSNGGIETRIPLRAVLDG
jgi:hypothetical protein